LDKRRTLKKSTANSHRLSDSEALAVFGSMAYQKVTGRASVCMYVLTRDSQHMQHIKSPYFEFSTSLLYSNTSLFQILNYYRLKYSKHLFEIGY